MTPRPPPIRRSSTTRSIGARSDFGGSRYSHDGEDDTDDDYVMSRKNSVLEMDPEREEQRRRANEHVAKYVSEKLERVRSKGSVAGEEEDVDEFEAQLDEGSREGTPTK